MRLSLKITLGIVMGIVVVIGIALVANVDLLQGGLIKGLIKPAYDENKCYDSDGGQNYETKGITYGKMLSRDKKTQYVDYCEGNNLVEYYCEVKSVKKEKKECECDSGICKELVLKIGESFSTNDKNKIIPVLINDAGDVFINVFSKYNGKFVKREKKLMGKTDNYYNKYGFYIGFVESDQGNDKIKFKNYSNCEMAYAECLINNDKFSLYPKNSDGSNNCMLACFEDNTPDEGFYDNWKFKGIYPKEYKEFVEYLTDSFKFCYEKEKDYLGFDIPFDEVYVKEVIVDSGGGLAAHSPTIKSFSTKDYINSFDLDYYENAMDDGICPSHGAQPHELMHVFMQGSILQNIFIPWLDEGLASYMTSNVIDTTDTYSYECSETGWKLALSDEIPYSNLGYEGFISSDEKSGYYGTGACFWDYITINYGENKFKEVLQKIGELRYEQGTYKFHQDILTPILGEDISELMKQRFGIPIDLTAVID